MLTPQDIEFMRNTRKEIVAERQHPIVLYYEVAGALDPITDEPIGAETVEIHTESVVTEIASMAQSAFERLLNDGVLVEKGDIWFSVDIDVVNDLIEQITSVKYDGRDYEIMAADKKGIGERNRVEFVGRLIS
ncbi:hypothetical protein PZE06_22335 [Robertmurraya sp. DFI.2.37]|uniref:hypothetical protein n=1 Tax=Robertmurraya sp. DFI.2.37 TaxID=3031819 RepID=UPI0012480AFD|nr:hypothetical protein [Robertmurraya sp. DFI.2.37]MDF1510876.1 hypothetical protein [Robertmurraya sp. DFI.2.37]